jgi:hypothetical protein
MIEFPARDLAYVIRLEEVLWGGVLLAITVAIHGIGMFVTLQVSASLKERVERVRLPALKLLVLIVAAWIIVAVNLIEVALWAGFFTWKDAQPNIFSAFYNALLNFTTLQAGYLPVPWRLLEGMLGMAGLITFAWSTGILFSLAQNLLELAIERHQEKRESMSGHRGSEGRM